MVKAAQTYSAGFARQGLRFVTKRPSKQRTSTLLSHFVLVTFAGGASGSENHSGHGKFGWLLAPALSP